MRGKRKHQSMLFFYNSILAFDIADALFPRTMRKIAMYKLNSCNHWSEDSVWLMPGVTSRARKMLYYVQEAGDFTVFSDYYTEREGLNSFLAAYTVSGMGRLRYRGKEFVLEPGSLFFLNCMECQRYENASGEPWHFLWFHFNGCSSHAYFEEFINGGSPVFCPGAFSCEEEGAFRGSFLQSSDSVLQMEKMFRDILSCCMESAFRAELLVSHKIESILTWVLFGCRKGFFSDGLSASMENIRKYLDRHFNEKVTLGQLAMEFALNKYTLQKEFKKATGFTPTEYLIACRIGYAKELLRCSELGICEISCRAGMENVSHFINLFKKSEGMTPGSYRKLWK